VASLNAQASSPVENDDKSYDIIFIKKFNDMLKKFLKVNKNLSYKIEPYFPSAKKQVVLETNIFYLYERLVAKYMNSRPNQIVVDVGGGNSCPFAKYRDTDMDTKIIAVDISEEALKNNSDVDEKRVSNILQDLPFEKEEVDLIVSRSVLEHLQDLEGFIINSSRILKMEGHCIHLFPSRFAPFALINQMLPKGLSRKLLHFLIPESGGVGGFPAYYNKCYCSAINQLFEKHGFEVVNMQLSYCQSRYFNFFLPLFLISSLYDTIINALKVKNLCSFILVVARKNTSIY
jgi:ubiquinone/menaquinone biosynthesis C-methylase UbiE